MKYGTPVVYEGESGSKHLALIESEGDNKFNADLVVFDKDGIAHHQQVARRDEGGGHTWTVPK